MTKAIKILPLVIGLPFICFFVEPIRATIELLFLLFNQCFLLKKIWSGKTAAVTSAL